MNELIIRKKIFLRNLFASFILFFSWFLFLSFLLCMFFSISGYYSDSISTLFLLIYFPMTQVKEILHFIFATLAIYSLPTLIGIVKLTTNKEKK
ncbi:hypothetical protein IGJ83_000356 [Enterococcus pernyi]|uniref:Uncharacterized protein n=2 Tax=Enterococcus mundtii TaxID=53346 RepID=A0A1V2UAI1_ENTMU|nr:MULTISPECIES: hypothetical protein [Enterococcus]ONN40270.1 hypothetical protein BTN92_15540 [Enterococcus mundtii]